MDAYQKWASGLGDKLVAGQRLENVGAHLKSKEDITTDGPFLEANEIIAGYIIIKAKDVAFISFFRIDGKATYTCFLRQLIILMFVS